MGDDRFHWELVSDGDTATRALNADERRELERLREMRRQLNRIEREMRNTGSPSVEYWAREIDDLLTRSNP